MSDGGDLVERPKPLWPVSGPAMVSDEALLGQLVDRLELKPPEVLTADTVYNSLVELRNTSDAWVKYYFISIALLVMALTNAISEFSLFGGKFKGAFFAPVAILYFSVCTVAFTNLELKNRLYKAFFRRLSKGAKREEQVELMLRYPLAFHSGKYIPHDLIPADAMLGTRHVLGLLPTAAVLSVGWLISVFGLMLLLLYDLYLTAISPDLPQAVTAATYIGFAGAMIMSGQLLRSPERPRKYVIGEKKLKSAVVITAGETEEGL